MGLGVPELVMLPIFLIFTVAPIGAAIWALITLHKLRARQEDIWRKLEAIEKMITRSPAS